MDKPQARLTEKAGPALVTALLAFPAAVLTARIWLGYLPISEWTAAAWQADGSALNAILFHDVILPRFAVSLLSGAALALAGTIFQQVLRNPLAEAGTIGVSSGAYLVLALTTFFAPALLAWRAGIAFAGSAAALLVVLGIAGRHRFSPMTMILAGLVVNLIFGALAATIAMFHEVGPLSLFIWASGSLSQNDWGVVDSLAPRLAVLFLIILPFLRPLDILARDDTLARALGLPVATVRALALVVAVAMAALVTSAVGVIGFVGLAAPAIARLAGARRWPARLFWGTVLGSVLLWLTDTAAQALSPVIGSIPAGAACALLGAPLLLLIPARSAGGPGTSQAGATHVPRIRVPLPVVVALPIVLGVVVVVLLVSGQGLHGWSLSLGPDFQSALTWRAPRMAGAFAAGALMAVSGVLIQKVTGNPLASPEVLGIGSGGMLAVIVAMLLGVPLDRNTQILVAGIGGVATLAAVALLSRRGGFTPERVLLVGVAVSTALTAVMAVLLASGDPRALLLLRWMAGSTYLVREGEAAGLLGAAVLALAAGCLASRWLLVLPLGPGAARSLGLDAGASRALLVVTAALAAACATMVIGPLSFVGLMAPHIAGRSGFVRPVPHVFASAVMGGLIMVAADWLGRNLVFPNEMPAGLIASLIGGAYFMILMVRPPIEGQ
ncbi:Fe(3+)-hydroxamate ABC transporter permease FhuB [Aquabacter sp. CN5-332]|uniref:Fe(3+)-hydroxamate ABC transporter permease FhuB n=1 Tax=Aquabacter sp. CN5-332 TaxID=3156608 RepID=UPI0032B40528